MSSRISVFQTHINNYSRQKILEIVDRFLMDDIFRQIATVNPEFLLLAEKNKKFRDVLNSCDLNIADGTGLHLAFWKQRTRLQARMAGADLMEYVLKQAEEKGLRVFCVVRKNGLSSWKQLRVALKKAYPNLEFDGVSMHHRTSLQNISSGVLKRMLESNIVLCNFGAPYQEIFLSQLRDAAGNMRLAMGIGGSFDYLTGILPRAPRWMRQTGLEWLWRLIKQPKRWKRIWSAVIVFPIRIFFSK